jgi:hypothetical protein
MSQSVIFCIVIRRWQAPRPLSCFVANEKGRIQQQVGARHHLLPFSLAIEHNNKLGARHHLFL